MITCPVCGNVTEPAAHVATIAICAACGSSLNVDAAGTVRRAVAQDTEQLSVSDLARLTAARAIIARPQRRR